MIITAELTTKKNPEHTTEPELTQQNLIKHAKNTLTIFQNKLPCRAWYTPKVLQDITEVQSRKSEIMTGFCKVKCRRNIIFEVRDRMGNIIESANNSAGIYSTIQGMPDPRPSVVRVTVYRIHDKKAVLKCPG